MVRLLLVAELELFRVAGEDFLEVELSFLTSIIWGFGGGGRLLIPASAVLPMHIAAHKRPVSLCSHVFIRLSPLLITLILTCVA